MSETLNAALTTASRERGGNQIQMWRAKTRAEKRKRALAKQGEAPGGDAASASGAGKAGGKAGGGKAGGRGSKGGKAGRGGKGGKGKGKKGGRGGGGWVMLPPPSTKTAALDWKPHT